MAKTIRTLKADMRRDEKLGSVSREARLMFVLLITYADDHGRFRAHPSLLRGELYPYDDDVTKTKVAKWLEELQRAGRVELYTVDGQGYGHLTNWAKHQRVDNASRSELPDPTDSVDTHDPTTEGDDPRSAANCGELPLERKGEDRSRRGDEKENVAAAEAAATADTLTAVWSAWRTSRRSARDKCERAITKALKANHDPTAIIDGARRWAAHYDAEGTEDTYVPMLTKWLNEQRWLMDCPTTRQRPTPAPPQLSKGAQIALDAKARLAQHQRAHGNVIDLPAVGSGT